jgi:hypothetical protein
MTRAAVFFGNLMSKAFCQRDFLVQPHTRAA